MTTATKTAQTALELHQEVLAFEKSHGLSLPRAAVLDAAGSELTTTGALSEIAFASNSAITHLVDALERSGFVRRTRSTEDRRVIWIQSTETALDVDGALDLQCRVRNYERSTGCGLTQSAALEVLRNHPEPMTTGAIVAELELSPSSATAMLDHLELRGLVQRERSLENRRVVLVRLAR